MHTGMQMKWIGCWKSI